MGGRVKVDYSHAELWVMDARDECGHHGCPVRCRSSPAASVARVLLLWCVSVCGVGG